MIELTPEEKHRIYLEEKARIEAQVQAGEEQFQEQQEQKEDNEVKVGVPFDAVTFHESNIAPQREDRTKSNSIGTEPHIFLGGCAAVTVFIIVVAILNSTSTTTTSSSTAGNASSYQYSPDSGSAINALEVKEALPKAEKLYQQKQYQEAVKTLQECKNPHSQNVLAKIAFYKKVGAAVLIREAKQLYKRGNIQGAIDKLDVASAFDNEDAKPLLNQYRERLAAIERYQNIQRTKEQARYYEGNGDVQIAVGGIKLKRSTEQHTAGKNGTFIEIYVSAKNAGSDIAHVNPNDFTMSTQSGDTAPHDVDTYESDNYFNAVELRPNQSTSGYLIFYLPKDTQYTLNYHGFSGTATKTLIP